MRTMHAALAAVADRLGLPPIQPNADGFAEALRGVIDEIRAEGHTTLRAIATALNDRRILSRRGGSWQVSNVSNLMKRLDGK